MRKVIKHFKCGLMDHLSRRMRDSAESAVNYEGPDQEVSEGKNISKWPRDILAKYVATFFFCPKNMPEAKLKSLGMMMALAEKISR